jgi:phosphomannomutase
LLAKIAKKNRIAFYETLTGFKWISKTNKLIFGYEEALGYCVYPAVVNDKDGISAAVIIVQLAGELDKNKTSLCDYLDAVYEEFGFHKTEQISLRFNDLTQIDNLLSRVVKSPPADLCGNKLLIAEDLSTSNSFPTPGIRIMYENQIRVIIRPSGTEPKLKCYIEVVSGTNAQATSLVSQIKEALTKVLS